MGKTSHAAIRGYVESLDAQVVREKDDMFDPTNGPSGYERVGFRIGGRVFWMACTSYPSDADQHDFRLGEAIATEIVLRWNAGILS